MGRVFDLLAVDTNEAVGVFVAGVSEVLIKTVCLTLYSQRTLQRDDQELNLFLSLLAHVSCELGDIGRVEGGVHLVEDEEWCRVEAGVSGGAGRRLHGAA